MKMHHLSLIEPDGVQILWHTVLVVGDDMVGHVENIRRASVIAVEHDIRLCLEINENLGIRSPPFIYGLIRITHDKEIAMMLGDGTQKFPVVTGAILHLIDHHIVDLFRPLLPGIGEMLQYIEREEKKIVIIEGIQLELKLEVAYNLVGSLRTAVR